MSEHSALGIGCGGVGGTWGGSASNTGGAASLQLDRMCWAEYPPVCGRSSSVQRSVHFWKCLAVQGLPEPEHLALSARWLVVITMRWPRRPKRSRCCSTEYLGAGGCLAWGETALRVAFLLANWMAFALASRSLVSWCSLCNSVVS